MNAVCSAVDEVVRVMGSEMQELRVGRPARLSRAQRWQQLLDTALRIVRDEGADQLTLGRLAESAGVSRPIAYEHFGTRTGLLIDLYRSIDERNVAALQDALADEALDLEVTIRLLADAYIRCSVEAGGVWQAVKEALSGSRSDDVLAEASRTHVAVFASALRAHTALPVQALELQCVALTGAGDALSEAMLRGACSEQEAADAFASLIAAVPGLRR